VAHTFEFCNLSMVMIMNAVISIQLKPIGYSLWNYLGPRVLDLQFLQQIHWIWPIGIFNLILSKKIGYKLLRSCFIYSGPPRKYIGIKNAQNRYVTSNNKILHLHILTYISWKETWSLKMKQNSPLLLIRLASS